MVPRSSCVCVCEGALVWGWVGEGWGAQSATVAFSSLCDRRRSNLQISGKSCIFFCLPSLAACHEVQQFQSHSATQPQNKTHTHTQKKERQRASLCCGQCSIRLSVCLPCATHPAVSRLFRLPMALWHFTADDHMISAEPRLIANLGGRGLSKSL